MSVQDISNDKIIYKIQWRMQTFREGGGGGGLFWIRHWKLKLFITS